MQGFYKDDNGFLVWSADRVLNERFELWLDQKDTYTYPVEGWYWFDSEIEARNTLSCYGPQPFPSWTVNTTTARWEAPTPHPTDEKQYAWDESTLSWVEVQ
jgi:hypothetical protein